MPDCIKGPDLGPCTYKFHAKWRPTAVARQETRDTGIFFHGRHCEQTVTCGCVFSSGLGASSGKHASYHGQPTSSDIFLEPPIVPIVSRRCYATTPPEHILLHRCADILKPSSSPVNFRAAAHHWAPPIPLLVQSLSLSCDGCRFSSDSVAASGKKLFLPCVCPPYLRWQIHVPIIIAGCGQQTWYLFIRLLSTGGLRAFKHQKEPVCALEFSDTNDSNPESEEIYRLKR